MKKPLFALLLTLTLFLAACAPGQAPETSPAPEPESPSSVSEPAAEPEAEPEPTPEPEPESSQPEPEPEPEPSQPEEPSPDPDGPWENPDTAFMYTPEQEQEAARVSDKAAALEEELKAAMPKDIYGTISARCEWYGETDHPKVMLEITVMDEKAVDDFLANWQGTGWEALTKSPAVCSKATADALAKKIEDYGYDFGPGTVCKVYERWGYVVVDVDYQRDEDVILLPEEIKKIAKQEGLSEVLTYNVSIQGRPCRTPEAPAANSDGTIVNPDT